MNGKQKARIQSGIYKPDSIKVYLILILIELCFLTKISKDVAESLGINNLSEDVASALAGDVEYRIHQVVEVRKLL